MKSQEDFIDDEVVTEDDLILYKLINIDSSYSDAENDLFYLTVICRDIKRKMKRKEIMQSFLTIVRKMLF